MSKFDPPADPFGSDKQCRICDADMLWDDWTKEWYCPEEHDAKTESSDIEILEQEIKWHNKHGGESGKSEAFEIGFIAGLKQALYLLNAAQNTVLSQEE